MKDLFLRFLGMGVAVFVFCILYFMGVIFFGTVFTAVHPPGIPLDNLFPVWFLKVFGISCCFVTIACCFSAVPTPNVDLLESEAYKRNLYKAVSDIANKK